MTIALDADLARGVASDVMNHAKLITSITTALACIAAHSVGICADPPPTKTTPLPPGLKEVPLYAGPLDIEFGPAVQFGGPYPFPIGFGGRMAWFARAHRYFSYGADITYTQAAKKAIIFNAPTGGSHWRLGFRGCTHASLMFFCLALGFAGTTVDGADNIPRSAFPNDAHFIPMVDIGANWMITQFIRFRPMLETGAMLGVPVVMVDNRPDQVFRPFPLMATLSLNLAFALPTALSSQEGPK